MSTLKITSLSMDKENKVNSISGTFLVDGDKLTPLKVNEDDRPEVYTAVKKIIDSGELKNEGELAVELFDLMSPEARVRRAIDSSFHLSSSITVENGKIYFTGNRIESTLENHLFSLLEDNSPKDEKKWASYVRFLDNLFQNANEEIRHQLFRWMDYENKAGVGFGITDDGCIVGYKGCGGTVINPTSVHSGFAIVNGEEMNGHIPNRVGSVIRMPRSAVQHDPSVGCSTGLHVGTRNYASQWAPILLLVKVNPRDVVSVPFECDSQKMRVCEYTVLEVTDGTAEHKRFFDTGSIDNDFEDDEYDDIENDEDVFYDEEETSDHNLTVETAEAIMRDSSEIVIQYDGKLFSGVITSIYYHEDPSREGVIVHNFEDDEIKHIKLHRIEDYDIQEEPVDEPESPTDEDPLDYIASLLGKKVEVSYDNTSKVIVGSMTTFYNVQGSEGVILYSSEFGTKHIKLHRIDYIEEVTDDVCENCDVTCDNCPDLDCEEFTFEGILVQLKELAETSEKVEIAIEGNGTHSEMTAIILFQDFDKVLEDGLKIYDVLKQRVVNVDIAEKDKEFTFKV